MSGLEFLPFLAIPTLVCTIIQTVAQCKKLQLDMRAQKAQEAASNDSQISGHLRGHSRDVCNTFNNCVVILGSQFTAGDAPSIAELQNILKDLQEKMERLEEGARAAQRLLQYELQDDQSVDTQLERDLKATKLSIEGLATRRGWIPPDTDSGTKDAIQRLLPSYSGDTDFCAGALHLQHNPSAVLSSISSELPDKAGYKCDYCSLEFRYVGIRLSGLVVLSESEWRSLAKYHIQASISWSNLTAWYMCAVCHGWNHCPPQIFASPVAFRLHMKGHK